MNDEDRKEIYKNLYNVFMEKKTVPCLVCKNDSNIALQQYPNQAWLFFCHDCYVKATLKYEKINELPSTTELKKKLSR